MSISIDQLTALRQAFPQSRRDELARILTRARADLDHIMYVLGSGAPSTVKRATVIELALEGKPVAEIAAAVTLPEARVEQIVENVLAFGLPALYPSFSENVPVPAGTHLWGKIEPMIKSLPPSRGVRTAAWTPAIVLDYLVNDGTLADASVSQITDTIKRSRDAQESLPPTFHYEDTMHQQGKPPTILAMTLFFLVGPAIVAFGFGMLSKVFVGGIIAIGFGVVFSLLNGSSLFKMLQERALLRKVGALQNAKQGVAKIGPQSGSMPAIPRPPVPHDPWPHPPFSIGHVLSLPEVNWQTDSITDTSNGLGQPPTPILYLWVFAAQSDQGGFETEGWPQLGPVHLLLNATALTINKLAHADELLVADQSALETSVAAYDDRAGAYPRTNLFTTIETSKNMYRGYPIHSLVCTDGVWKPAFRELAARSRIAIVNLSGFNPSHPGLEFEILHLLAGGPPTQFVFLYERTTDADAVITSVLNLWSRLESMPVVTPELHFFRIPESQEVGYALQFGAGMPLGFGWFGNIHLDREGPYTPIAARILAYLDQKA